VRLSSQNPKHRGDGEVVGGPNRQALKEPIEGGGKEKSAQGESHKRQERNYRFRVERIAAIVALLHGFSCCTIEEIKNVAVRDGKASSLER
jgi:hypothetical protein